MDDEPTRIPNAQGVLTYWCPLCDPVVTIQAMSEWRLSQAVAGHDHDAHGLPYVGGNG